MEDFENLKKKSNVPYFTLLKKRSPSRSITQLITMTERKYDSVENEPSFIIDAVKRWFRYLCGQHFNIIINQQAVNLRFNTGSHGIIKKEKYPEMENGAGKL